MQKRGKTIITIKRYIFKLFGIYLLTDAEANRICEKIAKERLRQILDECYKSPAVINGFLRGDKIISITDRHGVERKFSLVSHASYTMTGND